MNELTSNVNSDANKMKDVPVFIVSSGRAGTTLLRAMLNASDELHFPHESDFIARAFPFYRDRRFATDDYREVVKFFKRSSQKGGWGLPEEYLVERLKESKAGNFSEINSVLYESYLAYHKLKANRWGIKAPVLIAHINRIFSVFPNAKIIHLVRDGRDVCLSYRTIHEDSRIPAFGPGGVVTASLYWVDGLRRVENYSGRIYELRYEDLLASPAEQMRRLSAYLGIRYNPIMHTNYEKAQSNKDIVIAEHQETIHAKVTKGIDKTNMGKYLSSMSKKEIFLFELIASPYLVKYHYKTEYPWLASPLLSPFRQVAYLAARLFNYQRYRWRDKAIYRHATVLPKRPDRRTS